MSNITSFAQLKKEASKNTKKLSNKLADKGGYNEDSKFWKPKFDEAGNAYAVIRFLPAPMGEEEAYVKKFSYGFKGPTGKWYIEDSPVTIGLPDPVYQYNSYVWDKGDEEEARKNKRRVQYISNIIVLKHPARPEDEGKQFPYKYGAEIMGKIEGSMNPKFPTDKKIDPFNFWDVEDENGETIHTGDFILKAYTKKGEKGKKGIITYERSEFTENSMLDIDDEEYLENLWKNSESIENNIKDSKFKSYDELVKRLKFVLQEKAEGLYFDRDEGVKDSSTKSSSSGSKLQDFDKKINKKEAKEVEDEDDGEPPFDIEDNSDGIDDDSEDDIISKLMQDDED